QLEVEVLAHAAAGGDAGVQVGEVEAAGQLDGAGDHGLVGLERADVGRDEVAAELVGQGRALGLVEVGDDYLGPGVGQRPARGAAQPAGAAGDQGDVVAEVVDHGERVYARDPAPRIRPPGQPDLGGGARPRAGAGAGAHRGGR